MALPYSLSHVSSAVEINIGLDFFRTGWCEFWLYFRTVLPELVVRLIVIGPLSRQVSTCVRRFDAVVGVVVVAAVTHLWHLLEAPGLTLLALG